ncbi:GNAT family N-acetyltransferase [Octadecabacter ascidiaceicola]|uniref:Acetyltransferase (GNAT) family protein n=1 Tax=Octadecabacter ascidiaceicola TaxID=1655543 RepID=A0A238KAV0_9RHOB|nr:GNAT family N-acetyltransferase [Octadecabacter ascidiaceicola]SMX39983.1 Acetyltransferase (GNAT) family protein [Octadecabacter ascidiaceicola]
MTPETLTSLIEATWPAKSLRKVDGWTIREGAGGGSRVSAATASVGAHLESYEIAAEAMQALGQTPLFMIRAGEDELDALLEHDGYVIKDPVTYYTAPTNLLATKRPPPVTCFQVWPPLAAQAEIWAEGGINDARLTVMHRVTGAKTTILGRQNDTPAGTAFAAIHNGTAMVHAIETATAFRRQGLGRHMLTALSFWAKEQGAETVALLVTRANVGANALYASLGMTPVGGYHYRIKPEA